MLPRKSAADFRLIIFNPKFQSKIQKSAVEKTAAKICRRFLRAEKPRGLAQQL